jgi:hypothetical protein
MSEASRSMIDGMMGRLGEMADLSADDQARETVNRLGREEASLRSHPAVAGPSPEGGRDADNEFRSPTAVGVSD